MMWVLHSGLLSFTAAAFIAFMGVMTWSIGRSVPVAVMNVSLVLLNITFGLLQVATHPGIWR